MRQNPVAFFRGELERKLSIWTLLQENVSQPYHEIVVFEVIPLRTHQPYLNFLKRTEDRGIILYSDLK